MALAKKAVKKAAKATGYSGGQWEEHLHKRDSDGKFAEKAGIPNLKVPPAPKMPAKQGVSGAPNAPSWLAGTKGKTPPKSFKFYKPGYKPKAKGSIPGKNASVDGKHLWELKKAGHFDSDYEFWLAAGKLAAAYKKKHPNDAATPHAIVNMAFHHEMEETGGINIGSYNKPGGKEFGVPHGGKSANELNLNAPASKPSLGKSPKGIDVVSSKYKKPGELTPTGKKMPGVNGALVYKDDKGDEWLVKFPGGSKGTSKAYSNSLFLVDLDVATSRIQSKAGMPVPSIHAKTVDGKTASVHKMYSRVQDAFPDNKIDLKTMNDADIREIQKNMVLDWLLSNHDPHSGNFLKTDKGVIGIDKGQSFKYFGKDKLTKNFGSDLNPPLAPNKPVYSTLMQQHINGEGELFSFMDDPEIRKTIERLMNIPDEEYKDLLEPYADKAQKQGLLNYPNKSYQDSPDVAVEAFLQAAVDRKNNLAKDFDALDKQWLGTSKGKTPGTAQTQQAPGGPKQGLELGAHDYDSDADVYSYKEAWIAGNYDSVNDFLGDVQMDAAANGGNLDFKYVDHLVKWVVDFENSKKADVNKTGLAKFTDIKVGDKVVYTTDGGIEHEVTITNVGETTAGGQTRKGNKLILNKYKFEGGDVAWPKADGPKAGGPTKVSDVKVGDKIMHSTWGMGTVSDVVHGGGIPDDLAYVKVNLPNGKHGKIKQHNFNNETAQLVKTGFEQPAGNQQKADNLLSMWKNGEISTADLTKEIGNGTITEDILDQWVADGKLKLAQYKLLMGNWEKSPGSQGIPGNTLLGPPDGSSNKEWKTPAGKFPGGPINSMTELKVGDHINYKEVTMDGSTMATAEVIEVTNGYVTVKDKSGDEGKLYGESFINTPGEEPEVTWYDPANASMPTAKDTLPYKDKIAKGYGVHPTPNGDGNFVIQKPDGQFSKNAAGELKTWPTAYDAANSSTMAKYKKQGQQAYNSSLSMAQNEANGAPDIPDPATSTEASMKQTANLSLGEAKEFLLIKDKISKGEHTPDEYLIFKSLKSKVLNAKKAAGAAQIEEDFTGGFSVHLNPNKTNKINTKLAATGGFKEVPKFKLKGGAPPSLESAKGPNVMNMGGKLWAMKKAGQIADDTKMWSEAKKLANADKKAALKLNPNAKVGDDYSSANQIRNVAMRLEFDETGDVSWMTAEQMTSGEEGQTLSQVKQALSLHEHVPTVKASSNHHFSPHAGAFANGEFDSSKPVGSYHNPHAFKHGDTAAIHAYGYKYTDHNNWDPGQKSAWYSFSGSSSGGINTYFRTGSGPQYGNEALIKKQAKDIVDSYKSKNVKPLDDWTTVVRGTSGGWELGIGADVVSFEDMKAMEGKVVRNKCPVSTSLRDKPPWGNYRITYKLPPGFPMLALLGKSAHPNEAEVLLPPGMAYRIKEVKKGTSPYQHDVLVEVVDVKLPEIT